MLDGMVDGTAASTCQKTSATQKVWIKGIGPNLHHGFATGPECINHPSCRGGFHQHFPLLPPLPLSTASFYLLTSKLNVFTESIFLSLTPFGWIAHNSIAHNSHCQCLPNACSTVPLLLCSHEQCEHGTMTEYGSAPRTNLVSFFCLSCAILPDVQSFQDY
jgi:hypothetical protein